MAIKGPGIVTFAVLCKSEVSCPRHPMADVSQRWPWQLPGEAAFFLPLATPACVRCEMSPPAPHGGRDQVLSDTGDAGDVAAAASVTRQQPRRPVCSCSAASLQWQWPSPLVPSCSLQCCSAADPGPGHIQQQTAAGLCRVCCQVLVISHRHHQNLLHTLKWNIFFFFADGITGCLLGPGMTTLHHQPGWLMSHIMPGISHLQVCKTRHHLKTREKNGESKVDGLSYNGT